MKVSRRAHLQRDRAGDPLDGLVNMFDVGVVLAVVRSTDAGQTIIVKRGEHIRTLRLSSEQAAGVGTRVGSVYRLPDGRLVYVTTP